MNLDKLIKISINTLNIGCRLRQRWFNRNGLEQLRQYANYILSVYCPNSTRPFSINAVIEILTFNFCRKNSIIEEDRFYKF